MWKNIPKIENKNTADHNLTNHGKKSKWPLSPFLLHLTKIYRLIEIGIRSKYAELEA
jgi:hypothetical protein